jgi:hypothetical protein
MAAAVRGANRIRALLGVVLFGAGVWYLVSAQYPMLVSDWTYRDAFVPATGVTVSSARCKVWGAVLFHDCTIEYQDGRGQTQRVSFGAFGPSPDYAGRLLRVPDHPDVLTNSVALSELTNRTIFAVAMGIFSVFLVVTCLRRLFARAPG